MTQNLKIYLFFSFPLSIPARLPTLLEQTLGKRRKFPEVNIIHWNFPVYPFMAGEKGSADIFIKNFNSSDSFKDILVPMGYSGTPHHLLTTDEIEKELSWITSPPEGYEFTPFFADNTAGCMPRSVDFYRDSSISIYSKQKNPAFLPQREKAVLPAKPAFPFFMLSGRKPVISQVSFIQNGTTLTLPQLAFTMDTVDYLKKDLNKIKKTPKLWKGNTKQLILRFDFSEDTTEDMILKTLTLIENDIIPMKDVSFESIENCSEIKDTIIEKNSLSTGKQIKKPADLSLSHHDKHINLKLGDKRSSSPLQGDPLIRQVLALYCSPREESIKGENEKFPGISRRTLQANMQGEALLAGSSWSVLFSEGRYSGIFCNRNNRLISGESAGFIDISEKNKTRRELFSTISAFSFESEQTRGLREYSKLEMPSGEPAEMVLDYMFIEEFDDLVISLSLIMPEFSARMTAPFELPVFTFSEKEKITITTITAEGEIYEIDIHPEEYIFDLVGQTFFISNEADTFMVSFPGNKGRHIQILPFRIHKERGKYILSINPAGSYTGREVKTYKEHLTMILGLREKGDHSPPVITEKTARELQPNCLLIL